MFGLLRDNFMLINVNHLVNAFVTFIGLQGELVGGNSWNCLWDFI